MILLHATLSLLRHTITFPYKRFWFWGDSEVMRFSKNAMVQFKNQNCVNNIFQKNAMVQKFKRLNFCKYCSGIFLFG